jgi:hypothetical protein
MSAWTLDVAKSATSNHHLVPAAFMRFLRALLECRARDVSTVGKPSAFPRGAGGSARLLINQGVGE